MPGQPHFVEKVSSAARAGGFAAASPGMGGRCVRPSSHLGGPPFPASTCCLSELLQGGTRVPPLCSKRTAQGTGFGSALCSGFCAWLSVERPLCQGRSRFWGRSHEQDRRGGDRRPTDSRCAACCEGGATRWQVKGHRRGPPRCGRAQTVSEGSTGVWTEV